MFHRLFKMTNRPDPFVIDVDKILLGKGLKERIKFEDCVDDYMTDTGWLIAYGLPINPKREQVRQKLCKVLYC